MQQKWNQLFWVLPSLRESLGPLSWPLDRVDPPLASRFVLFSGFPNGSSSYMTQESPLAWGTPGLSSISLPLSQPQLGPVECPFLNPRMKYSHSSQGKFNPWIGTYCRSRWNICDVCPLLVQRSQEIFNPPTPNTPIGAPSSETPGSTLAGESPS